MNAVGDRERADQAAVELEVRRLAEQLMQQVNKVNEIAHQLVARIEGGIRDA